MWTSLASIYPNNIRTILGGGWTRRVYYSFEGYMGFGIFLGYFPIAYLNKNHFWIWQCLGGVQLCSTALLYSKKPTGFNSYWSYLPLGWTFSWEFHLLFQCEDRRAAEQNEAEWRYFSKCLDWFFFMCFVFLFIGTSAGILVPAYLEHEKYDHWREMWTLERNMSYNQKRNEIIDKKKKNDH